MLEVHCAVLSMAVDANAIAHAGYIGPARTGRADGRSGPCSTAGAGAAADAAAQEWRMTAGV